MVALTFLLAAIFSGAALYVGVAEQPARLKLDDRSLLIEWKAAYKRGAAMQAPIALLGFLLGFTAWWLGGDGEILIAAILLGANLPYTLLVMLRINNQLMKMDESIPDPAVRDLVKRWGRLHAVRTGLGLASSLIILADVLTPPV